MVNKKYYENKIKFWYEQILWEEVYDCRNCDLAQEINKLGMKQYDIGFGWCQNV